MNQKSRSLQYFFHRMLEDKTWSSNIEQELKYSVDFSNQHDCCHLTKIQKFNWVGLHIAEVESILLKDQSCALSSQLKRLDQSKVQTHQPTDLGMEKDRLQLNKSRKIQKFNWEGLHIDESIFFRDQSCALSSQLERRNNQLDQLKQQTDQAIKKVQFVLGMEKDQLQFNKSMLNSKEFNEKVLQNVQILKLQKKQQFQSKRNTINKIRQKSSSNDQNIQILSSKRLLNHRQLRIQKWRKGSRNNNLYQKVKIDAQNLIHQKYYGDQNKQPLQKKDKQKALNINHQFSFRIKSKYQCKRVLKNQQSSSLHTVNKVKLNVVNLDFNDLMTNNIKSKSSYVPNLSNRSKNNFLLGKNITQRRDNPAKQQFNLYVKHIFRRNSKTKQNIGRQRLKTCK